MLAFFALAPGVGAERPITSAYNLEIGRADILDTYVSPLKYDGLGAAFTGSWSKLTPWTGERISMRFDASISGAVPRNPARNATLYDVGFGFSWSPSWRFMSPQSPWQICAGPGVGFEAGVIYQPRNSNNVVALRGDVTFNLQAEGSYALKIGRLPVTLSDRVSLPTLGVVYTPAYGETYFEIWAGNHDGLAHLGWWGNHFRVDNLLSASLNFGKRSLTLGYRFKVWSSYINHINVQHTDNFFVVGFSY